MIAAGKVVTFHYTLTNDAGDTLDSSREHGEPLPYLHGGGNIVPGLEKQLEGLNVGDTLNATVPPGDGYGERSDVPPQQVPRGAFPPDVDIQPGMSFGVQDQGQTFMVWVVEADDEHVTIDTNHPLAGETLHFDVEIMGVRDATSEEMAHGHPHGPDGHHHH